MIKISKLADYAVVVLGALARHDQELVNASALAEATRLPEPTVSKVLKLLTKGDIVQSSRGASGGYQLTRKPREIKVAEIIMAIDGPVSMTACVEGAHECCDFHAHCLVKGRWDDVNTAIRVALEGITLADMIAPRGFKIKNKKEAQLHERL
jgi:FeS assembly SUF system regulator